MVPFYPRFLVEQRPSQFGRVSVGVGFDSSHRRGRYDGVFGATARAPIPVEPLRGSDRDFCDRDAGMGYSLVGLRVMLGI
jgi:hypothetical protein